MTSNDPKSETSRGVITRRTLVKGVVLFAAVALLFPLQSLVRFMYGAGENRHPAYPRVRVANLQDIAANESLLFEYPHKERPAVLIRLATDNLVAYDGLCTHLGCQVHYNKVAVKGWEKNPQQIFSPCHGGVFDPATGKVLDGPPPRPLPKIRLEFDEQGDIYANGYESGLPLYGES